MNRRELIVGASALGLSAATGGPAFAKNYNLTVTSGHPPTFLWVSLIRDFFIPEVDKRLAAAGADKVAWTQAYGGTVAKLGGEVQAIQSGVSDLGVVSMLFQASELPLQNVSYAVPFGSDNLETVVKVLDEMNQTIPAMVDAFKRYNQVFLAGMGIDTYHLWTKFPVRRLEDLNGRKIAAPGPSANWLKGTGAVPVAANLNVYYNEIQTGVYEGALTFTSAAAPLKLHEVAPHVTLLNFGAMYSSALVVNADTWKSFSPGTQQIFREVALEFRKRFIDAQTERAKSGLEQIRATGGQVTPFPPEERARWAASMPNVPGEWAAAMEAKKLPGKEVLAAYLDGLAKNSVVLPRDWRA